MEKAEQIDYIQKGWVHIKNFVPEFVVKELRERAIKWRNWVEPKVGTPCKYGGPVHWKGLGCAGMYDEYLMEFYRHEIMEELSSELLNTKNVWLYNDQIVVKLPNDNFKFEPHTDNSVGGNSNEGKNTVNICVILDNFTDENGTLEIFNKNDGEKVRVYPKAGDVVAIHGDTPHQSEPNNTENPRCLYACVYSSEQLHFHNFYSVPFSENPRKNKISFL